MKIAVYTYLENTVFYNAFVTSFKRVNTLHDYTFILAYHGDTPNSLADVEVDLELNSRNHIQYLHNLINSNDYDFVIFANNNVYCIASIDNIISSLNPPNELSVYCNIFPIAYSNEDTDTNGVYTSTEDLDRVINFSFCIVNCCNINIIGEYDNLVNNNITNVAIETILAIRCKYICANEKLCLGCSPCHDRIDDYYTVDLYLNKLNQDSAFTSHCFYYLSDYKGVLDELNYSNDNITLKVLQENPNNYIHSFYREYYKWFNFEGIEIDFE